MLFHPLSIGDPTRYLCLTTQRACTILCILLTITQIVVYAFLPRVLRYVLIAIAALMFGVVLTSIIKLQQTLLVLSLVFTTLLQVPTLLVIAKTIIAESFQDEYTSIRCHTYFGDYQCWLYSLSDVYLWIAIIVGILSIAIYVLLGVGLQKLRMLSAGVVAAMFVQPPSNVNIPQQGVSHNGITPSAPVAVVPMYPPPVCMVTNPANSCVHCQNSQQYASPTTVPLQPS